MSCVYKAAHKNISFLLLCFGLCFNLNLRAEGCLLGPVVASHLLSLRSPFRPLCRCSGPGEGSDQWAM